MKEQAAQTTAFSLDTIAFLFRRPWLFIFPFILILTMVFTYLAYIPLLYKTTAMLSLGGGGAEVLNQKLIQQKTDLIANALIGESIRQIVSKVWPDVNKETDPERYNDLINWLRSRGGIQMNYDNPRDPRFLTVSFMDGNPQVCYKVVQATIDIMISENRKISGEEVETRLAFLRKQVDFYKEKLQKVDQEISEIKSELQRKSPELSDSERFLINDVMEKRDLSKEENPALQKIIKYDETITELNLQLLDAKKAKEDMEKRLKSGDFDSEPLSTENINEDTLVKEYSQAIAQRKLSLAELMSRGYLPAHPDIKRLQSEIGDLKSLRENRIEELSGVTPADFEKTKKSKEKILKDELRKIEFQIETLQDKISLVGAYRKKAEEEIRPKISNSSEISDKVSQLVELQNEKEINMNYYLDLRKKLEEEGLKGRIEKDQAGFKIEIIEPPKVPLGPIPFQRATKIFMGLILAIAAGAGLSYVADMLDDSVRSTAELRKLLGLPVLATIDKMNSREDMRSNRLRNNAIMLALAISVIVSHFGIRIVMKLF